MIAEMAIVLVCAKVKPEIGLGSGAD